MEPFQLSIAANGIKLFRPARWSGALTAGFSGRAGGVSKPPWSGLNIGLHVGDEEADVLMNRMLLAQAEGWPLEAWTSAEQVHGNRVGRVGLAERGRGGRSTADAIAGCDALMTDEKGVLLASFYADCVPLYFYDPEHGAIALAHAGWKGTVARIAAETISAMERAYGSKPERIEGAIGPSIGDCCYEMYGDAGEQIGRLIAELQLDGETSRQCLRPGDSGKVRPDLKEINRQIMIKAGILPIHIEISKWCTGCSTDLFYSHRTEGGRTGRMASWIGMGEDDEKNAIAAKN